MPSLLIKEENIMATVEEKVREILIECPVTRRNDNKLISFYYKSESSISLDELMPNFKEHNLPCVSSIIRARQRVQAMEPELAKEDYPKEEQNVCINVFLVVPYEEGEEEDDEE